MKPDLPNSKDDRPHHQREYHDTPEYECSNSHYECHMYPRMRLITPNTASPMRIVSSMLMNLIKPRPNPRKSQNDKPQTNVS